MQLGSDVAVAQAPIQPLAWEPSYDAGMGPKKQKTKNTIKDLEIRESSLIIWGWEGGAKCDQQMSLIRHQRPLTQMEAAM